MIPPIAQADIDGRIMKFVHHGHVVLSCSSDATEAVIHNRSCMMASEMVCLYKFDCEYEDLMNYIYRRHYDLMTLEAI